MVDFGIDPLFEVVLRDYIIQLHPVVVKRPGAEKPMMLLTTLNAVRTRNSLWEEGYITRWRVEETIRFIKSRVVLST